jgi:zinc-ribbon domain
MAANKFCSACGAALRPNARFCDACGHDTKADSQTPAAIAETQGAEAQALGQYSADGKWWWNGTQWMVVQATVAPSGKPRKAKRMVRRLSVLAVVFAALTAANYFFWPLASVRSLFVNVFGVLAVLFTLWLVALVAVRFARGSRSKIWAGAAIGVLVLEVGLSAGMNANANAKTVATLPVLQSYYAEVADAVALGNLVVAGTAPSGVTFATVKAQADGVQNQLATMDVPAPLMDYAGAIHDWAFSVSIDVPFDGTYAPQWADLTYQADPFSLTMTTEQADAATAAAMARVAVLTTYDQYAKATQNKDAERYIGSRLDAQAYWLQAIYSSTDPNWVSARLPFVEPISNYPVLNAAASDLSSAKAWPKARWTSCSRNMAGFVACGIPQMLTPLAVVWKADINPSSTYATPSPAVVAAQQQLAVIDGSHGQIITGSGVSVGKSIPPPANFVSQCQAQGGVMGNPVYDRSVSRVPTSEGGWTCRTKNGRCFDLMTYSGNEYKGDGDNLSNGSAGCPEMGLKPTPLVPVAGNKPAPTSNPAPTNGAAGSWDGTYTTAPISQPCSGTATAPDGTKSAITQTFQSPGGKFTVSGNVIQGPGGGPISAGGQAVLHGTITGGTGSLTETLSFVHDANGGAHFSGTIRSNITTTANGGSATLTCSGAVSGSRN